MTTVASRKSTTSAYSSMWSLERTELLSLFEEYAQPIQISDGNELMCLDEEGLLEVLRALRRTRDGLLEELPLFYATRLMEEFMEVVGSDSGIKNVAEDELFRGMEKYWKVRFRLDEELMGKLEPQKEADAPPSNSLLAEDQEGQRSPSGSVGQTSAESRPSDTEASGVENASSAVPSGNGTTSALPEGREAPWEGEVSAVNESEAPRDTEGVPQERKSQDTKVLPPQEGQDADGESAEAQEPLSDQLPSSSLQLPVEEVNPTKDTEEESELASVSRRLSLQGEPLEEDEAKAPQKAAEGNLGTGESDGLEVVSPSNDGNAELVGGASPSSMTSGGLSSPEGGG